MNDSLIKEPDFLQILKNFAEIIWITRTRIRIYLCYMVVTENAFNYRKIRVKVGIKKNEKTDKEIYVARINFLYEISRLVDDDT